MVKRAFVDLQYGQLHLRIGGAAGRPPLVMLHTNPTSSREVLPLLRRFARDRLVVAPDTPGLGDSDPLPGPEPTIADYAAAVAQAIDRLGLGRFDLYGTHTGANIAVEIALAHPDRARRLVLDGIALYSPEMRADLLANYAPAITPSLDGQHLLWAWHFMRDQHLFWPWFRRTADRGRELGLPDADTLHDQVVDVLKGIRRYHRAYRASFLYEKERRLPLLRTPTLVASSVSDVFYPEIDGIMALVPGATKISLPPYTAPDYLDQAERVFRGFLDAA